MYTILENASGVLSLNVADNFSCSLEFICRTILGFAQECRWRKIDSGVPDQVHLEHYQEPEGSVSHSLALLEGTKNDCFS